MSLLETIEDVFLDDVLKLIHDLTNYYHFFRGGTCLEKVLSPLVDKNIYNVQAEKLILQERH